MSNWLDGSQSRRMGWGLDVAVACSWECIHSQRVLVTKRTLLIIFLPIQRAARYFHIGRGRRMCDRGKDKAKGQGTTADRWRDHLGSQRSFKMPILRLWGVRNRLIGYRIWKAQASNGLCPVCSSRQRGVISFHVTSHCDSPELAQPTKGTGRARRNGACLAARGQEQLRRKTG